MVPKILFSLLAFVFIGAVVAFVAINFDGGGTAAQSGRDETLCLPIQLPDGSTLLTRKCCYETQGDGTVMQVACPGAPVPTPTPERECWERRSVREPGTDFFHHFNVLVPCDRDSGQGDDSDPPAAGPVAREGYVGGPGSTQIVFGGQTGGGQSELPEEFDHTLATEDRDLVDPAPMLDMVCDPYDTDNDGFVDQDELYAAINQYFDYADRSVESYEGTITAANCYEASTTRAE